MKSWLQTLHIILVTGTIVFCIFYLLGLFVDPEMGQDVRAGIVISWAILMAIVSFFTVMFRHVE